MAKPMQSEITEALLQTYNWQSQGNFFSFLLSQFPWPLKKMKSRLLFSVFHVHNYTRPAPYPQMIDLARFAHLFHLVHLSQLVPRPHLSDNDKKRPSGVN
ncbi:hypothetical protein ACLOJK_029826 [Asimina triloba]